MKAITVGMILYCLLCVVVLLGLSLYQEIKHNRAIEGPDDEDVDMSTPEDASAEHAPAKVEPEKGPTTRRAA